MTFPSGLLVAAVHKQQINWTVSAEVSHSGRLRTNEVLPTDNGKSISVGTGGGQHRPGVREEHGEAAHLAATEGQHRLVGDPADLQQRDCGDTQNNAGGPSLCCPRQPIVTKLKRLVCTTDVMEGFDM